MIFNAIAKQFQARKQQKLANSIKPVNANYEINPASTSLYSAAKNLYSGRMPGANAIENAIYATGANTVANANRNATDASQALAVSAASQAQSNSSLNDLAVTEANNKLQRFGALSNATSQMVSEGDKVFQDKLRRYYDDLNYKRALEGAAMQNRNAIWGTLDDVVGAGLSFINPAAGIGGMRSSGRDGNVTDFELRNSPLPRTSRWGG